MSGAYQEYAEETAGRYDWPIPQHAYLLSYFLIVGMTAIWVWQFLTDRIGDWGLSAKALTEGRFETIPLHMMTHGPIFHIAMNMYALHVIGPRVIARLGSTRRAAGAFFLLFFLSGLVGSALYLALHPRGSVPMVGASGAIYGLLGLLVRLPPPGDEMKTMDRDHAWRLTKEFVRDNGWLFVALTLPNLLAGREGGLAWEAHLGGFLFGLATAPLFWKISTPAGEPPEVSADTG